MKPTLLDNATYHTLYQALDVLRVPHGGGTVADLRILRELQDALSEMVSRRIVDERSQGFTFEEIGDHLGVSKQSAHKAFTAQTLRTKLSLRTGVEF